MSSRKPAERKAASHPASPRVRGSSSRSSSRTRSPRGTSRRGRRQHKGLVSSSSHSNLAKPDSPRVSRHPHLHPDHELPNKHDMGLAASLLMYGYVPGLGALPARRRKKKPKKRKKVSKQSKADKATAATSSAAHGPDEDQENAAVSPKSPLMDSILGDALSGRNDFASISSDEDESDRLRLGGPNRGHVARSSVTSISFSQSSEDELDADDVRALYDDDAFANGSAKESWVECVPNCDVHGQLQSLLAALSAFHKDFSFKRKYSRIFNVMMMPCLTLIDLVEQPTPPQDVMVSTCSGSLQAQLQLLVLQKSGTRDNKEFYRHTNAVLVALAHFVRTCQNAIRTYHHQQQQDSDQASTASTSSSGPRKGLVHRQAFHELRGKVYALEQPVQSQQGHLHGLQQLVHRAFFRHRVAMLVGTVFLLLAIGSVVQTIVVETLQVHAGFLDEQIIFPFLLFCAWICAWAWGISAAGVTAQCCSCTSCLKWLVPGSSGGSSVALLSSREDDHAYGALK